MGKLRVLMLTDSNGNPRGFPDSELFYPEETYAAQLREHYKDIFFWQLSIGDITTVQLINHLISYLSHWSPDIIIVQSGINDCVPEAYSLEKFQRALKKFKMIYSTSQIFWMEICAGDKYEEILPGVTQLIKEHNAIIRRIYEENIIELQDALNKGGGINASDHVHMSKKGHQIIKRILIRKIDQYLSTSLAGADKYYHWEK